MTRSSRVPLARDQERQARPKRTASRSPCWNETAQRFVELEWRALLDHLVVRNENHVGRLLREYVEY